MYLLAGKGLFLDGFSNVILLIFIEILKFCWPLLLIYAFSHSLWATAFE